MERDYELKVYVNGKPQVKVWPGSDGVNACARYADANPGHEVVAWREVRTGVYLYGGEPILSGV